MVRTPIIHIKLFSVLFNSQQLEWNVWGRVKTSNLFGLHGRFISTLFKWSPCTRFESIAIPSDTNCTFLRNSPVRNDVGAIHAAWCTLSWSNVLFNSFLVHFFNTSFVTDVNISINSGRGLPTTQISESQTDIVVQTRTTRQHFGVTNTSNLAGVCFISISYSSTSEVLHSTDSSASKMFDKKR